MSQHLSLSLFYASSGRNSGAVVWITETEVTKGIDVDLMSLQRFATENNASSAKNTNKAMRMRHIK